MKNRIEDATIEDYRAFLKEYSRSPSRGGNGRAWHSHRIKINGDYYSWRGLGFRQWIHKSDTVTFEWEWDPSEKYRNVDPYSVIVTNKNGNVVVRGERGTKQRRSSPQRAPVSRREWRD